jgi:hypothetical protein
MAGRRGEDCLSVHLAGPCLITAAVPYRSEQEAFGE